MKWLIPALRPVASALLPVVAQLLVDALRREPEKPLPSEPSEPRLPGV